MGDNGDFSLFSIICFTGALLSLIVGHYVYLWDKGHRDKSLPPMYNINGKRIYVSPPEIGLHLVLSFILALLIILLAFINYKVKTKLTT